MNAYSQFQFPRSPIEIELLDLQSLSKVDFALLDDFSSDFPSSPIGIDLLDEQSYSNVDFTLPDDFSFLNDIEAFDDSLSNFLNTVTTNIPAPTVKNCKIKREYDTSHTIIKTEQLTTQITAPVSQQEQSGTKRRRTQTDVKTNMEAKHIRQRGYEQRYRGNKKVELVQLKEEWLELEKLLKSTLEKPRAFFIPSSNNHDMFALRPEALHNLSIEFNERYTEYCYLQQLKFKFDAQEMISLTSKGHGFNVRKAINAELNLSSFYDFPYEW